MKKIIKKRAGFTLVELLIVIIIIGILAGSMMLVAGSGTEKAEAAKIVSNLRSLKAAALLYYADEAGQGGDVTKPGLASLDKYMDRKLEDMGKDGTTASYTIEYGTDVAAATNNEKNWYVVYTYPANFSTGVRKRLAAMKDVGLYGDTKQKEFKDDKKNKMAVMKAR